MTVGRSLAKSDGTGDYHCLRACLIWMLTAGFAYYASARMGFLPTEVGDGYLPDLAERFFVSPFYQIIAISFVGIFAYGVTLWFCAARALKGWRRGRPGTGRRICHFVGVPPEVCSDSGAWREFANFGLMHATSPIRDAAALFPGLGFLGTVVGVSIAIGSLEAVMSGSSPEHLLGGLHTAFDTTFLGLVAALSLGILSILIGATENRIGALLAQGVF